MQTQIQMPTTSSDVERLVDELRGINVFADLSHDSVRWLIEHGNEMIYEAGETVFKQGDIAEWMTIVLEGEMHAQPEGAGLASRIYIARAKEVTGKLPFSRMTHYAGTGRAVVPTRIFRIHIDNFAEMLERIPVLTERLVGVMSDRVREVTRMDEQRDKLTALGKISAGLAHELNNPAAAARRAAQSMREAIEDLRCANQSLDRRELTTEQRAVIANIEREITEHNRQSPMLDSLAKSDLESDINDWLDARHIEDGWRFADKLAEVNMTVACLDELNEHLPTEVLTDALARTAAQLTINRLVEDVETSTTRISELVGAIKEYSYMDQSPRQQVNVQKAIDSTLVIFNHKIKKGIKVTRDYDCELPLIEAYGSELNQVWTNLIDNATDAMRDGHDLYKGELTIKTLCEHDALLVAITDTGAGIPEDVKPRVFEPFFTTKPMGEGTGLGLDAAYRIVRKHAGDIRFESAPGKTTFYVRLPMQHS